MARNPLIFLGQFWEVFTLRVRSYSHPTVVDRSESLTWAGYSPKKWGEEFSLLCSLWTGLAEEWPSRGGAALGSVLLWFAAMGWGSETVRTQPFLPELQAAWVLLRTRLAVPGKMVLAVSRVCAHLSLGLHARSLNLQMLLL